MDLLIVESPTKAKHIAAMLGRNYTVLATFGHLKDLPKKELGIDLENGFEPQWQTVRGKSSNIDRIKEAAKKANQIILATDPDREGEGIAKHVHDLLSKPLRKKVVRAEFTEITKEGVERGLRNTRPLDEDLADAQQARRVLDRLVGFMVSPMLWRQLKGSGHFGVSAGRVQSAALHLIRQRHDEIQAFEPESYWSFTGEFSQDGKEFVGELTHLDGVPIEAEPVREEREANAWKKRLEAMEYRLQNVELGERRYSPPAPFVTTTLLQAASAQLGFGSKKTMKVAQELFESGLITYMRTDSPRVSEEAQQAAREWIKKSFGSDMVDAEAKRCMASEGAQDAHECIRPTNVSLSPENVKKGHPAELARL